MTKSYRSTASNSIPEKVVIIGGGPGGTACALALHKLAAEKSIGIHITVLEGKEFDSDRHHNQCVGVLSPPLPSLLEYSLGIDFPRELCIGDIERYILQSAGEKVSLEDQGEPSVAVRRVQFDAYMLEQVMLRDIKVFPFRAVDLEFHADKVIIYTENESVEADVVVGAFGMDEGTAAMFSRTTAYRKPEHLDSVIVNLPFNDFDRNAFGSSIHAFLPKNRRIEFGAITPKCDHLTINIAGQTVDTTLMRNFLELPEVIDVLNGGESATYSKTQNLNYYKGRFPRSTARGFYGDRYIMVGDASGLVRAFKGKGATTAIQTGIRAADTILNHGISAQAFQDYYHSANQDIIKDLPYGRGMRLLTLMMSNFGLMGIIIRAARKSPTLQTSLFGAVSGHTPYRKIITEIIRPKVIWDIMRAIR
jgi:flavin-dependent dehydrogenase